MMTMSMGTALINRELLRPTNVSKDIAMVAVLLAPTEDDKLTVKCLAFKEPPTVKEITDILFEMPEGSTIVVENPHACQGCSEPFENSENPNEKFCKGCVDEMNGELENHTWVTADPSDVCEGCGEVLEGGEDVRIMNDEGEDFLLCEGCAEDSDYFDSTFEAVIEDDYSKLEDDGMIDSSPPPGPNMNVTGKDEEE